MNPSGASCRLKRYFRLFAIAFAVDILLSVTLWLIKPEILHLINNFTVHGSILDLACMSFGRCIFLILILAILETFPVQRSQSGVKYCQSGATVFPGFKMKSISFLVIFCPIVYSSFKAIKVALSFADGKGIDFQNIDYVLCIIFVILLGYLQQSGSINFGEEPMHIGSSNPVSRTKII